MGKSIIIKGADFSVNAIPVPEYVELISATPNGFYMINDVVEGTTTLASLTLTEHVSWLRYTAQLDVDNYNYTSLQFSQGVGNNKIICLCILDENGVILKAEHSDSNLLVSGIEINSSNYPTAKQICYSYQNTSTTPPVLIKEGKS